MDIFLPVIIIALIIPALGLMWEDLRRPGGKWSRRSRARKRLTR